MPLFKGIWGGIFCFLGFVMFIPIIIILKEKNLLISSRKTIHIIGGLFAASFPWLAEWKYVLFAEILATFGMLGFRITSIIGQRHKKKALGDFLYDTGSLESYGEVLFPVTTVALTWLTQLTPFLFSTPILVLSLSDSCAALFGKRYGHNCISKEGEDKKTISGSLAFFISSFLIIFIMELIFQNTSLKCVLLTALITALLSTGFEMSSSFGTDNLLVPLSMFLLLYSWEGAPAHYILEQFAYLALLFLPLFLFWFLNIISSFLYFQLSAILGLAVIYRNWGALVSILIGGLCIILFQRNRKNYKSYTVRPMILISIFILVCLCSFRDNERTTLSELIIELVGTALLLFATEIIMENKSKGLKLIS